MMDRYRAGLCATAMLSVGFLALVDEPGWVNERPDDPDLAPCYCPTVSWVNYSPKGHRCTFYLGTCCQGYSWVVEARAARAALDCELCGDPWLQCYPTHIGLAGWDAPDDYPYVDNQVWIEIASIEAVSFDCDDVPAWLDCCPPIAQPHGGWDYICWDPCEQGGEA